jgi:aminomethyltransferase
LQDIRRAGVTRKQVGLAITAAPLQGPNTTFWSVHADAAAVGKVTSAVYSPRLQQNIALAMVDIDHSQIGTELSVQIPTGTVPATVVAKPFFDPKKSIASAT